MYICSGRGDSPLLVRRNVPSLENERVRTGASILSVCRAVDGEEVDRKPLSEGRPKENVSRPVSARLFKVQILSVARLLKVQYRILILVMIPASFKENGYKTSFLRTALSLCTGILRFGGLLGPIWLGAWTTENFSMQHARSLGAFSDLLSLNALSQLAKNHESASAAMELLATHLTLLGKSNQIRLSRPPNLKIPVQRDKYRNIGKTTGWFNVVSDTITFFLLPRCFSIVLQSLLLPSGSPATLQLTSNYRMKAEVFGRGAFSSSLGPL